MSTLVAEMEARMTAAESLAEELQMENDAQATEISTLRQRLNVSEHRVGELETQLEGLREAVQELQNTNTVRKVAFSSSLLTSGEGNTGNGDFVHLIYKNVISNIGNRYNPHTGYFTAPVRGVYYFRFTAHIAHSDSSLVMFLIKNGDMMVTSGDRYTTSTDPEDGICNGVVLQLEEGDVISVYISGKVWDDSSHRTTFSGFLLFLLAQKHSSDILLQALNIDSKEGVAETQKPSTEASAVSLTQGDIWVELRNLRDMVVEQKVELRHLTARVTAAESQMETLQEENTEMEARMTAAESLAEELQMENDAQATEISTLHQRLNVSEHRVGELETQLEVRKVAFSSSLLTSGEGNTGNGDFVHLIYKNVISNIGNRYNPHTGYFTAPVRGVYYFRFTAHIAHSDSSLVMFLIKNGDMMVTSGDRYTTSTDPEDGICNGVVLQLEEGDVISVYISGKVWDDSSHRTTFSGFLLFLLPATCSKLPPVKGCTGVDVSNYHLSSFIL
ncbi:Hypothetical predicted protein [Scomber scombrus]|uniref:C1q domain-containing protein n=1 Tax=Scomber scombrus TaxID=13677 RepID=A0AAV1NEW1_SCOSC